jgi:hypothetical protein
MAKSAAKKVIKDNKEGLEFAKKASILTACQYLGSHLIFKRRAFFYGGLQQQTMYILSCLLSFIGYQYLAHEAKVIYDPNTKEIISEGAHIMERGMHEYVFDVLYLNWTLQVCAPATSYVWYAYLLVPLYFIYKLWSKILYPLIFQSTPSTPRQ